MEEQAAYTGGPAPIALFTHRRPVHTRRTIAALAANPLARATALYAFSDAPRNAGEVDAVTATRAVVGGAAGFARVELVERQANMGLADNIVDGVEAVVRRHGRVIVVEDDVVTSPHFLRFMNDALERYADAPRVMQVSGYMLPIDPDGLPETFFTRNISCWGWGTWDRAWVSPNRDATEVMARFTPQMRRAFDLDTRGTTFWEQLRLNRAGQIRTWAVFWYAHVFLCGGLGLSPRRSLVHNIGHDGTGTHSSATDEYAGALAADPITYFSPELTEDRLALSRMRAYYARHGISRARLAARRYKQWLLG